MPRYHVRAGFQRSLPLCGILLFLGTWGLPVLTQAAPIINEVQSSNTLLPDPFGQLIDWVEIYNPDSTAFDLSGHYLSDSSSNRTKYPFPNGTTIGAGGYLLVWCGQASEFPVTGPYPAGQLRATGFAISSGGEPVLLTAPDGTTTVDEFPALAIGVSRSLGRGLGAQSSLLFLYVEPTQSTANTTAGISFLDPPTFSVAGGMFTSNVSLSLSTAISGATIRYTTDGSDPTESSSPYAAPLTLTSRDGHPNTYAEIPTNRQNFPYDESWQPPEGEVFKINVIRARLFKAGFAPGRIATHSYLIHPDGPNRYPFPVLSINTDPAGLFGETNGIYVHGVNDFPNYSQDGSAWERPGQVEFFETNGALAFRGDMGVRLHGNNSVSRPRKSLRIYSRDSSGAPFGYRIFPQKEIHQFATFLLRNSGNDWGQAMLRDAFLTSLAAHTGLDHQSSRPAVVFLDGEYWGLHNLRDRIDEGYYFQHHGLTEMEFTQLDVHWQPTRPHWPVYDRGNPDPSMLQDFEDILNRANNDEFSSESSFATLASRIDIENYIDYNAFQIFCGNGDWPGNNTRLWRAVSPDFSAGAPKTHDGRWRWILFDTDFGLGLNFDYVPGWDANPVQHAQVNTLALATSETQTSFANAPDGTLLLRKLLENPVFRTKFINRCADLLNTSLSTARTTHALSDMQAQYAPGIAEHRARWRQPYDWTNDMARIRTFLEERPAAVRGHMVGKFGLAGTAQVDLILTNANQGVLSVNTLRLEAGTVGIGTNPAHWTGTYFRGVPISLQALPKPGYRFSGWSRSVAIPETVHAVDMASSYSSWVENSNSGNGFGPWWFWTTATSSSQAGYFLQNSRGGWGLYANSDYIFYAGRSLVEPLGPGKTLMVRLKHGSVAPLGSVGIELRNSSWQTIFKFERRSDSGVYWINDQPTTVGITTAYLDLELSPLSGSSFFAKITPLGSGSSSHSGTFYDLGTPEASDFLFYNYTAGSGGEADFFVTSLKIITPGSALGGNYTPYSTNAVLAETLSADAAYLASFEPVAADQWRLAYGLNLEGGNLSGWQDDRDADGLTNLQEYFFGFSPLTASVQGNPIVPEAPLPGGSSFSFLYRKNKAATDVAGIVKWSSDLAATNWNGAGVVDTLVQDHGSYETRRATVPIQSGESKKFMRLEISGP